MGKAAIRGRRRREWSKHGRFEEYGGEGVGERGGDEETNKISGTCRIDIREVHIRDWKRPTRTEREKVESLSSLSSLRGV